MQNARMCSAAIGLIALLAPGVKAQGVGFLPIPGQFNDGAYLNVTPVVSADRRYVRLGLTPQFNALNGFNVLSVPAAVGGGGNGGGGLGGLGGAGGGGGGLGGLGGGGGAAGGFRSTGIGGAPRAARPSAYKPGGFGAFDGVTPAGMTGGLDPMAEAFRRQRMAAALAVAPRPAAPKATATSTASRRRAR